MVFILNELFLRHNNILVHIKLVYLLLLKKVYLFLQDKHIRQDMVSNQKSTKEMFQMYCHKFQLGMGKII